MRKRLACLVAASAFAILGLVTSAHAADHIKVGISRISGYPGVPIAIARGYFAAQGLDTEMVFFDSAQPIAVGVASGDLDFGVSGMSAGFYALAAQGQLRFLKLPPAIVHLKLRLDYVGMRDFATFLEVVR